VADMPMGMPAKIPANLAQYFAAVRLPEASFIPSM